MREKNRNAIPTVKQILLYTQYKSHFVRQTTGLGIPRRMMQDPLAVMRKYGLHGYMLITLDNFWTLLSSKSPFLMVSWYCQFLLSGLETRTGRDLEFCLWLQSYFWKYWCLKNSNITYWFPQSHSLYRFYSGDGQRLWIETVPWEERGDWLQLARTKIMITWRFPKSLTWAHGMEKIEEIPALKVIVKHFGKCAYSLSWQELDEKIDTTHACTVNVMLQPAVG